MHAVRVHQLTESTLHIEAGDQRHEVEFRSESAIHASGEVQALVGAAAGMRLGLPVEVDLPVSAIFRDNFETATALMASWNTVSLKPTRLVGGVVPSKADRQGAVSFFSGGLDSFYTAITRSEDIDRLVLVHGFDMFLGSSAIRAATSTHMLEAATDLGKELVEVETNLRTYSDRYADWGANYHGMALAAIGHSLGADWAFIPSTFQRETVFPWGSHPEIDPLLGGSAMVVEHHGGDVGRTHKAAEIARSPVALRHLRVCYKNMQGGEFYNCAKCEKCVRTQINLLVAGGLDRCATLPSEIDLSAVRQLDLRDSAARVFARENIGLLRVQPENSSVARALRIAYTPIRGALRSTVRRLPVPPEAKAVIRRIAARMIRAS